MHIRNINKTGLVSLVIAVLILILNGQDLFDKRSSAPLAESLGDSSPTAPLLTASFPISPSPTSIDSNEWHQVLRVVDGDTVETEINGREEKVRLIGVDTPEVVDGRKTVQCFGQEASEKAKTVLEGKMVKLEADPATGDRDRYSRLLRYIFLEDGSHFNRLMITEGYATEYTYNLPYKYQSEFRQAESEAKEAKRGLWADGACQ